MLTIKSLDEFRSKVAHKQEMREAEIAPNLISFCYMVAAEGTFDDAWSRECRGIVFDKTTGEVVGRPLHKFFNVNEREETRAENLPSQIERLMDKRDGSMIHTVKVGDSFRLKSKKSFESDVAIQATAWVYDPMNAHYVKACTELSQAGKTIIFEYTAPDARIVLPYKQAELRVLHVRENESGRYATKQEVEAICAEYSLQMVDNFNSEFIAMSMLIDAAKTSENIEGWIAQFADGEMVKVKCDWYLKRHRAMTFLRERDIAQLVLDEGLDDVKSLLVGDGVNIDDILQIEARVLHQLRFLAKDVESIILLDGKMERKDFAIKYKSHEHFGLLMASYTGKQPDFKGYFERNILRESYSLRQLTLLESTAEAE